LWRRTNPTKAEILFADALERAARWIAVLSSKGKGFLPSFVLCGFAVLETIDNGGESHAL
jgi:hypothetical protein